MARMIPPVTPAVKIVVPIAVKPTAARLNRPWWLVTVPMILLATPAAKTVVLTAAKPTAARPCRP